uniref:Peptidase C1A papain C-terminal domain-containing protein n=1 Tax=Arundo donax TaxID=35708 RepID=A0A0A9CNJ5_ARUDO
MMVEKSDYPREVQVESITQRGYDKASKVNDLTWPSLSESSMPNLNDYEKSWMTKRFHGQNISPTIKNQGNRGSCFFHSLIFAAEIELKRQAALRVPPRKSKMRFSPNEFINEYGKEGDPMPKFSPALKMLKEKGVSALGKNVERGKYCIKGYKSRSNMSFKEIKEPIRQGMPIVGGIFMDEGFTEVGPKDIYDYDPTKALLTEDGEHVGHAVTFIGSGVCATVEHI